MWKKKLFLAGVVALSVIGLAAGTAWARPEATEEELGTARTLVEAHEAMGNLRSLPGGCPTAGQGVLELTVVFETAGLPAPPSATEDAWGNPVMAWCQGQEWAVISAGADGMLADPYAALPEVTVSGDDFVMIDEQRFHVPPHIERLEQMGRQKRTMADMRSVAIVFESYQVDNGVYPGAPTEGFVPVETIQDLVQPIYIRELPLEDAWGNPIWIWTDGQSYRIVSAGRDGIVEEDWVTTPGAGATGSLGHDIVMGDGKFLQWPEGPQS